MNAYNWKCILNLKDKNKNDFLFSGGILNNNNQNYIIKNKLNWVDNPEPIKIYGFKGKKIKAINNSKKYIFYRFFLW